MTSAIVSRPFERALSIPPLKPVLDERGGGEEDTRVTFAVRASDTLVVNGQGIAFRDGRRRGGRSRSDLGTWTVMKQRADRTLLKARSAASGAIQAEGRKVEECARMADGVRTYTYVCTYVHACGAYRQLNPR